jgi:hypothetical protein
MDYNILVTKNVLIPRQAAGEAGHIETEIYSMQIKEMSKLVHVKS